MRAWVQRRSKFALPVHAMPYTGGVSVRAEFEASVAVTCLFTRNNCEWQSPCKTSSSYLIHLPLSHLIMHQWTSINGYDQQLPCFHVHAMHALSPQPTMLHPALREGYLQQQLRHACPNPIIRANSTLCTISLSASSIHGPPPGCP